MERYFEVSAQHSLSPLISPDMELVSEGADGPRGQYARHPQVYLDLYLLGWLGAIFVLFLHFNESPQKNTV